MNPKVEENDFNEALKHIVPASKRTWSITMRPLPQALKPLLGPLAESIMERLEKEASFKGLHADHKKANVQGTGIISNVGKSGHYLAWPRLVICGNEMQGHTKHLAPALLHHLEHLPYTTLDIIGLHSANHSSPEEYIKNVILNLRQILPAILYLPDLCGWWANIEPSTQQVFLQALSNLEANTPVLLIVTVHQPYRLMPNELKEIFNLYQGHIYEIINPSHEERKEFFKRLLIKVFFPPPSKGKNNHKEMWDRAERHLNRILRQHSMSARTQTKDSRPNFEKIDNLGENNNSSKKRKFDDCGCGGDKAIDNCINKMRSSGNNTSPIKLRTRNNTKANVGAFEFESPEYKELKIDADGLLQLFLEIVEMTCDCPILTLEKLYAGLDSKIAKYENVWDRRNLIQDLKQSVEDFDTHILKVT